MPSTKKSENVTEREAHLNIVAEGIAQGKTIREQSRQLGKSMTAISYDRRQLRLRWFQSNQDYIQQERFDQLEKLNRIEEEAWEAWDRSIGEAVKQTRRVKQIGSDGAEQIVSEETTTLNGDPRFLEQIQKAVTRRCAILGLDAPKEAVVESVNTNVNVEAKFDIGVSEASRFLEDALGRGAVAEAEILGENGSVLPARVDLQQTGREQAVDTGSMSRSGTESERDAGLVGEGALQVDNHHVRSDDSRHTEQPGNNGMHSELQQTDSEGIPPTDQGGTGEQ